MKRQKIKYVQLEPGAFLTDPDFIKMKVEERGIYCHLILLLYSNGGSLNYDDKMHLLFNCSKEEFEKYFSKISHKFRIKNNRIYHKKVSKVLAHQKKLMQIARNAGLKGGRPKKGTLFNENETKNETKSN